MGVGIRGSDAMYSSDGDHLVVKVLGARLTLQQKNTRPVGAGQKSCV